MSKIITIYGASDDLVEVEGGIEDEFQAYGPWTGTLRSPDGEELVIEAEFGRRGADADWTIGVRNTATYPAWPMHFAERPDRDGDPALVIEVPDGTVLVTATEGEH
jgi:hypothetical protein